MAGGARSVARWLANTMRAISTSDPIDIAPLGARRARRPTFSAPACSTRHDCYHPLVARKLAIIGLVLLFLLLIIPLGIGMAMGVCPDCTAAGGPMFASACAMLAATIMILAMGTLTKVAAGIAQPPRLVTVRGLERPPRSS
jgi:hypothetical protein